MNEFIASFLKEPLKTIRRSRILYFGTRVSKGDISIFDRRGAVLIRKGEKSAADIGGGADPLVIRRPGGNKMIPDSKAMDSHFGWVYACVKAISDEMANIDFTLFSVKGDGEREQETEHEILDLLDGVNDFQTGEEFKKNMAAHLEMTGSAYLYLFGVKSFDDKPKAIYLLNPGKTKVVVNKTTFPYKVDHYEMLDDDREWSFKPYEVIHIKYPDPSDPFTGLGTVQGIAEWIDNDNYAMEYNRNFFRNGARMSGVFETDMTSVEQTQRLKISFEEQFAGVKNAYKSIIMPKGVKWIPTQVTSKDMDFGTLLDKTAERILAGFRVSKTILGTAESDTNRATAETADYVFAKRTIKPKMKIIVSFLNNFLVPRFEPNMYLSFNDPVPEDKAFRTQEMTAAVAGRQVITQNEAREQFMGLGPLEDPAADELSTTVAAAPVAPPADGSKGKRKAIKAVPVKKASRASTPAKRAKIKTQFFRNKEMRKAAASELVVKIAAALEATKKKSIFDMTDDEYIAVFYTHQKSRMDEFEPKVREVLKKVNKGQEKEVLENLSRAMKSHKATTKANLPQLFDLDRWINLSVDLLTPLMAEFFTKEAEAALRNINAQPFDLLSNDAIRKALEHRIDLLSRSYNETTMDLLAEKLQEGLDEGDGLVELTNKVSDIYAWNDTYRAQRVAQTEVVAVSNMANKDAWKTAGTVKTVKWYTSEKDNVCPFCQAMKGKVLPIEKNFFNKGETLTVGEGDEAETMTMDYSAIGGPPLHPNCGCFIRPDSFTPIV